MSSLNGFHRRRSGFCSKIKHRNEINTSFFHNSGQLLLKNIKSEVCVKTNVGAGCGCPVTKMHGFHADNTLARLNSHLICKTQKLVEHITGFDTWPSLMFSSLSQLTFLAFFSSSCNKMSKPVHEKHDITYTFYIIAISRYIV